MEVTIMCGGGLSHLPEGQEFEGYITREETGFSFRLPLLNSCDTLSNLALLLLNSEIRIAKLHRKHPFIPQYICGNKITIRDNIIALNKKYGLPGVRAHLNAA